VLHADCRAVLPALGEVDHCITDPPYSEIVHTNARRSGRAELPDKATSPCRAIRRIDIDFEHLDPETRDTVARECARMVRRWSLFFSDVESAHLWRESVEAHGMSYRRTGAWIRIGGAPQFTGDRPASGFECITMAHRKGRSRWHGGGCQANYTHPIVANRSGHRNDRVHTTQKPESLMLELVDLFTDEDEVIVDPFGGSGTTGAAALRRGRRIILIEKDPKYAALCVERCRAESRGHSLAAERTGQGTLWRT
jgi:DNA modification methylase